ncbi:hypothetical protein [Pseudomonas sp. O11]|uniref:hypothetical protein n=1 Tax=Pseudomonas sp. O11 TaxID=3159446 RepID=UPI00387B7E1F
MSKMPCNKLIAEVSGLTESQVSTYLTQIKQEANGDWLAFFGVEINKDPGASNKLSPSKIVRIPEELAKNWLDC